MAYTSPSHVAGGGGLPSSKYNSEIADNITFLHDGNPLFVGYPGICDSLMVPTANQAVLLPIVPRDKITIAGITYTVNTQAGNVDVGIYADDGNGTTASRLKSSGSVAMPASGVVTTNFTSSQLLDPLVKYWLAIAQSSAAARIANAPSTPLRALSQTMASALPLPATITFAGAYTAGPPAMIAIAV